MLIALMPEAVDSTDLFSGPEGRLLRNMLAALGVGEQQAYFATALPAAMQMPDWEGLAASGLGAVLSHHVSLARPERVMLLGNPLAPMLGEIAPPLLAALAPDQLLAHPRQRSRLWARLLDWMPAQ
jgi:DNA polymerase